MSPLITILLLAAGLAMDAFAAAVVRGARGRVTLAEGLGIAATFGLFQALMPLIGLGVGVALAPIIDSIDHWIAFVLLSLIGGQMIREALSDDDGDEAAPSLTARALVMLAIATSIDAAVAGVTLPLIAVPVPIALAIIGGVTFLFALFGIALGRRLGEAIGRRAEILGGAVLILLGVKILLEHLGG